MANSRPEKKNPKSKSKYHWSFWKKKHEETLHEEMRYSPIKLDQPNIEETYIATCQKITKFLDAIEMQNTNLETHYREYFNAFGFKSTVQHEENISATLKVIYQYGDEIIKTLKETDPALCFMNASLSKEDLIKYQSMYDALNDRLKSLWVELYDLNQDYQSQKICLVKKYIQLKYPNAKNADLENAGAQIVAKANLSDPVIFNLNTYLTLTDLLNYVEARHEQILTLEKSINEVHQLFIDAWVLTQKQGQDIDSIRAKVQAAKEDVKEGKTHLTDALRYAHKPSFI